MKKISLFICAMLFISYKSAYCPKIKNKTANYSFLNNFHIDPSYFKWLIGGGSLYFLGKNNIDPIQDPINNVSNKFPSWTNYLNPKNWFNTPKEHASIVDKAIDGSLLEESIGNVVKPAAGISKNILKGGYNTTKGLFNFGWDHKFKIMILLTLWKMGLFDKIANLFYEQNLEKDLRKTGGITHVKFEFENLNAPAIILTFQNGKFHSSQCPTNNIISNLLNDELKNREQKDPISIIIKMLKFDKLNKNNNETINAKITTFLKIDEAEKILEEDEATFEKANDNWSESVTHYYLVNLKNLINPIKLKNINSIKNNEHTFIEDKRIKPTYSMTIYKKNEGWSLKNLIDFSKNSTTFEFDDWNKYIENVEYNLENLMANNNYTWIIQPSIKYYLNSNEFIEYEFKDLIITPKNGIDIATIINNIYEIMTPSQRRDNNYENLSYQGS